MAPKNRLTGYWVRFVAELLLAVAGALALIVAVAMLAWVATSGILVS